MADDDQGALFWVVTSAGLISSLRGNLVTVVGLISCFSGTLATLVADGRKSARFITPLRVDVTGAGLSWSSRMLATFVADGRA